VIAERKHMSLPAVNQMADRLFLLGLLMRSEWQTDHRKKDVAVTPRGHRLLQLIRGARASEYAGGVAALPVKLHSDLAKLLRMALPKPHSSLRSTGLGDPTLPRRQVGMLANPGVLNEHGLIYRTEGIAMTWCSFWPRAILLWGILVFGPVAALLAADSPADTAAAEALHRLLDSEWEWRLVQFPERATSLGDHRYDDKVTDQSPAAISARRDHHSAQLAAIRAIDREKLAGEDRLSWDVLAFNAELDVRGDELYRSVAPHRKLPFSADDSPFLVNQMTGPQFSLPRLTLATRFANEADYRHYLGRLNALPVSLQQQRTILEAGRSVGWMPPRVAIARLPDQFASLLKTDLTYNPLFAPFQKIPSEVPAQTQTELADAAEHTIRDVVIPAVQVFRDYLATTYVPAGTATLGATQLPNGAAYYAWSLQRYNTTRMSAREIHELGLREVARIDGEMNAAMKEAGFSGTLAEFRTYLRTGKRFQFSTAEEELVAYRDIAKRIDPQLPDLFVELPRLPYGVRAMRAEEGNNAPHYVSGALDGSRAGWFEANTNNLAAWPRWMMDALVLHEAVPGHHLQIARAQELPGIPKLRRAYGNSGYSEGWGLYSEGLGKQLGLYADPYSWFGRLSLEAHRACRLVVDTGMHSLGWSRDKAIEYLIDHAQLDRGFAEAEIDRYLVWPGQATAYKVGEQEILTLREKAKSALGARFDLRRFHNAVLDHGALPLTVLETSIDVWIASEKSIPSP
jgi:uncharacterized protein (DUF885 family)